jgi:subtilase family serine protease
MKCLKTLFATAILLSTQAYAQPTITVPAISIEQAGQAGFAVHTHLRVMNLTPAVNAKMHTNAAPYQGLGYQTPASIACIYGLASDTQVCNPNDSTINVTAKKTNIKAIAIVDAYHYPNAAKDLNEFSAQFGLAVPNLTVTFANGKKPALSPNEWELEEALDLQWAHAMSPGSPLFLVEAASTNTADMLVAIKAATALVQAHGGGVVSMSWGMSEFSGQTQYDSYFNNPNVIYFASSGDSAGVNWPCASQNVICVGGTSLRSFSAASVYGTTGTHVVGDFDQEIAWNQTGGGISQYAAKPVYQANLVSGSFRGVPDVALAADPTLGGWIYYTPSVGGGAGWNAVGGTSWAAPMAAGITANSSTASTTSAQELAKLYANNGAGFKTGQYGTDLGAGGVGESYCGAALDLQTATGWDACTGLGSYYAYK